MLRQSNQPAGGKNLFIDVCPALICRTERTEYQNDLLFVLLVLDAHLSYAYQIENQSRFISEYGLPPRVVWQLQNLECTDHVETE